MDTICIVVYIWSVCHCKRLNLGAFGLQNSKYWTKQYKVEQHNTRQKNTGQIFMVLNNFLFYMIFGGRNAILVF